jgi:hypothetical protein
MSDVKDNFESNSQMSLFRVTYAAISSSSSNSGSGGSSSNEVYVDVAVFLSKYAIVYQKHAEISGHSLIFVTLFS